MNSAEVEKKFAKIVGPVAEENGLKLIKTEYVKEDGNYYLRAYVEKPEGEVSVNDCTMVSRIVSKKLDKEDFIEEAYTMEICSPGFME